MAAGDWLLHHCHIVGIKGGSYRQKQAAAWVFSDSNDPPTELRTPSLRRRDSMVTIVIPAAISGLSRARNNCLYRSTRMAPPINLIDTGQTGISSLLWCGCRLCHRPSSGGCCWAELLLLQALGLTIGPVAWVPARPEPRLVMAMSAQQRIVGHCGGVPP